MYFNPNENPILSKMHITCNFQESLFKWIVMQTLPRTLDDIHPLLMRIKSRGLEKWNSKLYSFYWFWCVSSLPNERSTLSKCTFSLHFFQDRLPLWILKQTCPGCWGMSTPLHMSITSKGFHRNGCWYLKASKCSDMCDHSYLCEWKIAYIFGGRLCWWMQDTKRCPLITHGGKIHIPLTLGYACLNLQCAEIWAQMLKKELRKQLTNCIVALRQKTQNSSWAPQGAEIHQRMPKCAIGEL